MKKSMSYPILFSILILCLFFGCAQQISEQKSGIGTDEFGCNHSAGETWCEQKSKCISYPEVCNTNENIDGADRDVHGCIGSAGYTWCESMNKCIRTSEQPCIRVVTEDFPPFNYLNSQKELDGQSVKIVKEIMRRTNQEAKIELMTWQDAYSLAKQGPNTIIFSIARTTERENDFKWAGPIGFWEYGFYSQKNTSINIQSLEGAKTSNSVCVVENDARHQILTANNFSNLVLVVNDMQCAKLISDGQVDLWFGSSTNFNDVISNANLSQDEFKYQYVLRQGDIYIAFSKDTPDGLVLKWQEVVDELKQDGTIKTIEYFYRPNLLQKPSLKSASCTFKHANIELSQAIDLAESSFSSLKSMHLRNSIEPIVANSVSTSNWDNAKSFLQLQSKVYPQAVHWYSNKSGSYYTLIDGFMSQNLKDREYFSKVMDGQSIISDVLISKSTGKPSIVIASAIYESNSVVGIIGSSIYLDELSVRVSNKINLPNGLYYFVVDENEKIILHSQPSNIGKTMAGIHKSISNSIDGVFEFNNGFGQIDYGVSLVASTPSLNSSNWTFVIATQKSINDQLCIVTEELSPYNFVDETGLINGQSSEIIRKLMLRSEQAVPIEVMQWDQAYSLASTNKNVAIFSIVKTDQREPLFHWIGPIAHTKNVFYANKNSNFEINLLDDARRVSSICSYKNDSKAIYLESLNFTNIVYEKDDVACLKKLVNNQVDLWIGDYRSLPILAIKANVNPDSIHSIYTVQKADYYMAFSKDVQNTTITRWSEALNFIKTDGSYDAILRKYSS